MSMICLGWPARCLHPNERADRRHTAASRQAAKKEGWAEVARTKTRIPKDAHLLLEFCPPSNHRRDIDGLHASMKAHLDGMAQAADVDDSGWTFTLLWGPKTPGGLVRIRVVDRPSFHPTAQVELKGTIA